MSKCPKDFSKNFSRNISCFCFKNNFSLVGAKKYIRDCLHHDYEMARKNWKQPKKLKFYEIPQKFLILNVSETSKYLKKYLDICVKAVLGLGANII